jgi:hypothetical protein
VSNRTSLQNNINFLFQLTVWIFRHLTKPSKVINGSTITTPPGAVAGIRAAQKIGQEILDQVFNKAPRFLRPAAGGVSLFLFLVMSPLDAGTAKPAGPAPPGKIWGGDYYIPSPKFSAVPKYPSGELPI